MLFKNHEWCFNKTQGYKARVVEFVFDYAIDLVINIKIGDSLESLPGRQVFKCLDGKP